MNPEDKKGIIGFFNQGFEEVVLLHIVGMQGTIVGMQNDVREIKETLDDHSFRLDRIERKLNAAVERQDDQGIEIKRLKDKLA